MQKSQVGRENLSKGKKRMLYLDILLLQIKSINVLYFFKRLVAYGRNVKSDLDIFMIVWKLVSSHSGNYSALFRDLIHRILILMRNARSLIYNIFNTCQTTHHDGRRIIAIVHLSDMNCGYEIVTSRKRFIIRVISLTLYITSGTSFSDVLSSKAFETSKTKLEISKALIKFPSSILKTFPAS